MKKVKKMKKFFIFAFSLFLIISSCHDLKIIPSSQLENEKRIAVENSLNNSKINSDNFTKNIDPNYTFRDPKTPIRIENISNNELNLEENDIFKIDINDYPCLKNNTINDIKMYSFNPEIATIDNFGNLKALKEGIARIVISNTYQTSYVNINVKKRTNDFIFLDLTFNKNANINYNFAFSSYYKPPLSGLRLLTIYDYKNKRFYYYPNTYFIKWSNNKEKVFVKEDNKIYLMNIDGTDKKILNYIDFFKYSALDINISYDGKNSLIYVPDCRFSNYEIYNYSFGAFNITQLTNKIEGSPLGGKVENPWSPKDNKIVFVSKKDVSFNELEFTSQYDRGKENLFLIDKDLKIAKSFNLGDKDDFSTDFSWSNDGNSILFKIKSSLSDKNYREEIRILNLSNGNIKTLFNSKGGISNILFNNKNDKIFFIFSNNEGENLFYLNKEDKELKQITQGELINKFIFTGEENDNILLVQNLKDVYFKDMYQLNPYTNKKEYILTLNEKNNSIIEIY